MNVRETAAPGDEVVRRWRRAADGAVLLDGFHAIKHALRFDARLLAGVTSDLPSVLALAGQLAPDTSESLAALLVEVTPEALRTLVPRPHPTSVAALAARPDRATHLAELAHTPRTAPIVLLDQPRNLGNAGAVIRLAAGFGVTGVITTGPLDPWHPTVVRGGAGLHFATAVERLDQHEEEYADGGVVGAGLPEGPLLALDADGEDIRGLRIPDDAVLAFGSERSGLSPAVRARADRLISLPMRPQVSSYNLATSVAMALFHWSTAAGRPTPTA
ncbi:TrmH family RNA methyltransferase [Streptomyces sp. NPDC058045]|uniref:TrmH family RNA methyltransferase n=1 Tax=Streptomyces sp. NPDC058045 TaxID=3346311 RepID=UPI0036E4FCB7